MKIRYIITTIVMSVLVASCSSPDKAPGEGKIFIVLFDISGSVDYEDIRKNYMDNFSVVLRAVDAGDILVAGMISDKSLAENRLPVNLSFPVYRSKTDNPMYEKEERKVFGIHLRSLKDSIHNEVSTLLELREASQSTDILGALQLAEKVFSNYGNNQKVLVIMSDMMHTDRNYNFERKIPGNEETSGILNELSQKERLPDLSQVKVYISGANTSDSDSFTRLQKFWEEYFTHCRADFSPKRFSAMLINFDE
ncbi:MAG: hypothetical protein JW861_13555 [Bacteroidales bacterium]|nr:hypothetical protein [Bacteroidales bacterium]